METGSSGIIGYSETRANIDAMKKHYREEYKKIVDKEKKADSDLFHNRWKVRLGSLSTRIALTFQPNKTFRVLSKLGTRVGSFLIQKIMELKNKSDKKKYKKQKDKLTADFINAEGEFAEFDVINSTVIEETHDDEEEKQFHR